MEWYLFWLLPSPQLKLALLLAMRWTKRSWRYAYPIKGGRKATRQGNVTQPGKVMESKAKKGKPTKGSSKLFEMASLLYPNATSYRRKGRRQRERKVSEKRRAAGAKSEEKEEEVRERKKRKRNGEPPSLLRQ
jgi:hypothetical protein